MNGQRRIWLDVCPGERRGVIALDGRPERLLIERDGEPPRARLGERWRARLRSRSPDRREAFVSLGNKLDGLLRLPAAAAFADGALVEGEVTAEAQGGKTARLVLIGPAEGEVGLASPAPSLEARLQAFAPDIPIERGPEARDVADAAQDAALASAHRLRGGGMLTIETTQALTAVDVDLATSGERSGRAMDANLRAIRHTARLLRLKGLGGTIAIDLIGFPKTAGLIVAEAERAFAPDQPGVTVLAPNRLGVLMLSRPRRERPLSELLLDAEGRSTAETRAQSLVRELEREGRADPGARLRVVCAPDLAKAAAPLVDALGPRFQVVSADGSPPLITHIERS